MSAASTPINERLSHSLPLHLAPDSPSPLYTACNPLISGCELQPHSSKAGKSLSAADFGSFCRGIKLLVSLAEPSRSWLPTFGCSDVQTTAAAALSSMAGIQLARSKIGLAGGITALVNILTSGSAEAQSNAAKAVERLAVDSSLSFQVPQQFHIRCTDHHGF